MRRRTKYRRRTSLSPDSQRPASLQANHDDSLGSKQHRVNTQIAVFFASTSEHRHLYSGTIATKIDDVKLMFAFTFTKPFFEEVVNEYHNP